MYSLHRWSHRALQLRFTIPQAVINSSAEWQIRQRKLTTARRSQKTKIESERRKYAEKEEGRGVEQAENEKGRGVSYHEASSPYFTGELQVIVHFLSWFSRSVQWFVIWCVFVMIYCRILLTKVDANWFKNKVVILLVSLNFHRMRINKLISPGVINFSAACAVQGWFPLLFLITQMFYLSTHRSCICIRVRVYSLLVQTKKNHLLFRFS